ncbi:butyrophilin subfamily 1 member A1-like isoform X3 [Labeo rohita]|uniref:Butyrophilin subfamily 1 member A1-like isoform X3 n=1 Tax=Labeo rohita TaxID=84645 RepID=A0A498NH31_LABRO|nr:butyrophilin subfamily 1 member A1-like isoform X3 [Labeo rohita]
MNITAILGHSVTFKCPSTHNKPVNGLYIQRMKNDKEVFINGFYKDHPMPVNPEYQNRTEVNEMELSMEMRNISVSDEGLYKCYVLNNILNTPDITLEILLKVTDHPMPVNPEYQNRTEVNEMELSMEMRNISVSDEGLYKCYVLNNILNTPDITLEILLKVTAEYSVPTVRTNCSEHKHSDGGTGMNCQLSCSAMGGYPRSTITWMGLNPSLTSVVYNWSSADNDSKTWTINQTIMYNCKQLTNVGCAIGGALSYTVTIYNDSKTWTINQTIMYNCKQLTNVGCAIGGALSYTVTICHSDVAMNITAGLGHSVTFRCPSTHSKPVNGLYIQRVKNEKEEVFINGFYKGKNVQVNPEYQNRTQVNEMELSMEMRNISVSDEGLYKCYVFNNILNTPDITLEILLKVTGHSDVAMNIMAVLGHSVTFKCPSTHSKPVNGLYIQRMKNDTEVFINGFYKGHPMPVNPEYQNRTEVNEMELSMEMRNISVSDEGLYKCVVFYSTLDKMKTMINLKVTAEYSVPTIKKDCIKRNVGSTGESCQLSCSAVGGYPQSTVTWVGLNSTEMSGFYNWNLADNVSETWTINQTIIFNCKQLTKVSCAIGGALSYTVTIWNLKVRPDNVDTKTFYKQPADEDDMKNPVCSFLALVLTLLLLTATPGTSGTSGTSGDSDVAMNITAVLGHSVTFKCPSTHSKPVNGLYIQRVKNDQEEVFIDGFYKGKNVQVNPEYQNRTQVNEMELSMEMRNISVSDEGLYKCYVFNNILNTPDITLEILLNVTAEYSVPTIKKDCIKRNDGSTGESCQLSCSAVGGYPKSTVTWVGLNSSEMSGFYNRNLADNVSERWTINQTIIFNCDQPISVSCAIADAVSYTITICEKESFSLQVIIAIIVVLAFVLLILVIIVMKCCCRRSETRRLEGRVDGADIPLA